MVWRPRGTPLPLYIHYPHYSVGTDIVAFIPVFPSFGPHFIYRQDPRAFTCTLVFYFPLDSGDLRPQSHIHLGVVVGWVGRQASDREDALPIVVSPPKLSSPLG